MYAAASATSITREVSRTGGTGLAFTSIVSPMLGLTDDDGRVAIVGVVGAEVNIGVGGEPSGVGVSGWSFLSFSLASSPSTRFNRASKTSVLGPLFFGTASGRDRSQAVSGFALVAGDISALYHGTYHIRKDTGILDKPRMKAATGCT